MELAPQVTLNANQQSIAGAMQSGVALRITLVNYGSNIPVVSGDGSTPGVTIGALNLKIPFVNGALSVKLWGNDVINPQGTRYCIQLIDAQSRIVAAAEYILEGAGSFDLAVLTPASTNPQAGPGAIYLVNLNNKGPQGDAGTIEVGTVTEGLTAEVTNTGTPQNAVLDFTLPEGPPGPAGADALIGNFTGNFVMAAAVGAIDGNNTSFTVQGAAGMFWLVFLNGQYLQSGPGYTRNAAGTGFTLPAPPNPDGRGPGVPDQLIVIGAAPVTGTVGGIVLIPDEDNGQLYQLSMKSGAFYTKPYAGS